jgi:hypothetical protein
MFSSKSCVLGFLVALMAFSADSSALAAQFDKIESSFELPQVQGNPFDFTQNDVKVTLAGPEGSTQVVPAFFDGGQTWRVRFFPLVAGKYAISGVTLNGTDAQPQNLTPTDFEIGNPDKSGFVRIDRAHDHRFVMDDGAPFYPLGYNLGWHNEGEPPIPETLSRMGAAGLNWSRIWMCAWDGKNLDLQPKTATQVKLGYLDLATARKWDDIVNAAQAGGVYFHLVLQHHGEFSTGADPNWQDNPWSKANGGWLQSPLDFFADPKAIALTKAKYRYIIARWGYSPAIMAWELFNEVENTDAYKKDVAPVAAWHTTMANFIRQQDPYHHLLTTSSRLTDLRIFDSVDYIDAHDYPPDVLAAMPALDIHALAKPYFYGEIGGNTSGKLEARTDNVNRLLWASIMSKASGAAQFWFWDIVERDHFIPLFSAVQKFVAQSGFTLQTDLQPINVEVQTPKIGPLEFGPGMDWGPWKTTDFVVHPSGQIDGIGGMAEYMQGKGNKDMFSFASFKLDFPSEGTFSIAMSQIAPKGAILSASLDGAPPIKLNLQAPPPPFARGGDRPPQRDVLLNVTLSIPIPAGPHTLRLENPGEDWVRLKSFVLNPYAPQVGVLAKANDHFAILWVYRRESSGPDPIIASLRVPGLTSGTYQITWWDTQTATVSKTETVQVSSGPLQLTTPPVKKDIALWITRQN